MAWNLYTSVSVGLLNVLLNTLVFFIAYAVGLLATRGIRNLLLMRIQKNGAAPVFCETESRFQRFFELFRNSRFFRSPTSFLIVLLSSVLFLFFEISAENGVDSSNFCRPKSIRTQGICARPYDGDDSVPKIIASFLYTQRLKWNNVDLVKTPIVQGLRKSYNGREAFDSTAYNKSLPVVVSNCSVKQISVIPAFAANITFQNQHDLWHLRMVAVKVKGATYVGGTGDVTANPEYYSAFLLSNTTGGSGKAISSDYFEYPNDKHIRLVHDAVQASRVEYKPVDVPNKDIVLHYDVRCGTNSLTAKQFENAVQMYHSTQVESSIHMHKRISKVIDGRNLTIPKPLEAKDLVKATIAMKAMDRSECEGETLEYTVCGVYDVLFFMPVIATLVILVVVVAITEIMLKKNNVNVEVPTTAMGWSKYAWDEICRQEAMQVTGEGEEPPKMDCSLAEYYIIPETNFLTLRRREQ